jgi:hypothetical protein
VNTTTTSASTATTPKHIREVWDAGRFRSSGITCFPMVMLKALWKSPTRITLSPEPLLHSIFNRTNNDNGIAAALLDGELYRLGILIAVIVLIAALALAAGGRRLSRAYRLELDANPGGVAHRRTNSST